MKESILRCQSRALHLAHEYLAFGKGLSDVDEADLWQKDLTGAIEHWIEVGQPEEKAILKACGRADRVSIYVYSHSASLWWKPLAAKVARARNLAMWSIAAEASQTLAKLAARNMALRCTIQERQVWISNTKDTVQIEPFAWQGAETA